MKTLRQQLAEAQSEVARLKKMARCPREPIPGWIGGIIQQQREALGWTLHELANRSGVAVGLLSRVESKTDANPTLNNLLKVAKAMKCPLSKIVAAWESEASNAESTGRSSGGTPG